MNQLINDKTETKKTNKKSKVMIIDDSYDILFLLESILTVENFNAVTVNSAGKALEILDKSYDAIILDLMMPEMDGVQFLEIFRKNKEFKLIPVIVLTAKNNSELEIARIYELGANDYVSKPFLRAEFIAKLKVHIKLKKLTEKLFNLTKKLIKKNKKLHKYIKKEELLNEKILERTLEIKEAKEKIEELNRALKYSSTHDELTKIYNRSAILSFLENDIHRAKRIKQDLCLIMFDIDFFKNINDTYGHLAGDDILRELAQLIKNNIREIDLIGRYGGEEFLIILPDTNLEEAKVLANRIINLVRKNEFKTCKGTLKITISIGIAEYKQDQSIDEFIDKADIALYEAKKCGRNTIKY